jgi:hypothetical protein
MRLTDILWAPNGIIIQDRRLIDLINSLPVQRLKNISQNGAVNYFKDNNGLCVKTSRYEHSIGCMILVIRLGGTIEEAIVALLHDVMHTAFSHTIDFVSDDMSSSYHEKNKSLLLEKFAYEFQYILGDNWKNYFDETQYPLIKKNNPFAIDVADYTARDCVKWGLCTKEEVNDQLFNLSIDRITGQLCCKNRSAIDWWKECSEKIDKYSYNAPWNLAINYYFAIQIKCLIYQKHLLTLELLSADINIENYVVDLIKDDVIKYTKNRQFELVDVDSYDVFKYKKITTLKIRRRFILPPLYENVNNEIINTNILYSEKDLVCIRNDST